MVKRLPTLLRCSLTCGRGGRSGREDRGPDRTLIGMGGVFTIGGMSVSHLRPGTPEGEDSSRNVPWLALWHGLQGENWHHNHHARPGIAQFGWTVTQVDLGWWVIRGLEQMGLATAVRRP